MLGAALAPLAVSQPARAQSGPLFSSARLLLLRSSALPRHYRYRGFMVEDNVANWDSGIKPVYTIDIQNGWIEGAREAALDPKKHDVLLAVQLFRTAGGARSDFGQFFTNAHPETIYEPGAQWLGGASVRGLGDRATVYRIADDNRSCPEHLVSGLTFVYGNGIFSVELCTETVGEKGATDLAKRLLARAHTVARH